jgi:hypothetical protein
MATPPVRALSTSTVVTTALLCRELRGLQGHKQKRKTAIAVAAAAALMAALQHILYLLIVASCCAPRSTAVTEQHRLAATMRPGTARQ